MMRRSSPHQGPQHRDLRLPISGLGRPASTMMTPISPVSDTTATAVSVVQSRAPCLGQPGCWRISNRHRMPTNTAPAMTWPLAAAQQPGSDQEEHAERGSKGPSRVIRTILPQCDPERAGELAEGEDRGDGGQDSELATVHGLPPVESVVSHDASGRFPARRGGTVRVLPHLRHSA